MANDYWTGSANLCPTCGEPLEPGAGFCTMCGTAIPAGGSDAAANSGTCSVCGAPLDPGAGFCIMCGSPVGAAAPNPVMPAGGSGVCPVCGEPLDPGASFCIMCGTPVSGGAVPGPADINVMTPVNDPQPFPTDPQPYPTDFGGTATGMGGMGGMGAAPVNNVPIVHTDTKMADDDDPTVRPKLLMLTYDEARNGCTKTVDLDGQSIEVTIPAGVDVNTKLDIPNYGYFDENTGARGPLRLTFFLV